eukprot:172743-Alexandrium_andersonii.AAC.1
MASYLPPNGGFVGARIRHESHVLWELRWLWPTLNVSESALPTHRAVGKYEAQWQAIHRMLFPGVAVPVVSVSERKVSHKLRKARGPAEDMANEYSLVTSLLLSVLT